MTKNMDGAIDKAKFNRLMQAASKGSDRETRKLLLFLVNEVGDKKFLSQAVNKLRIFYPKWSQSKKYIFCKILLESDAQSEAIDRLSALVQASYLPATCQLGTILLYEANSESDREHGLDLLKIAQKAGHPIAHRNLWVYRAKNAIWPLKSIYYLFGVFFLLRWLITRSHVY